MKLKEYLILAAVIGGSNILTALTVMVMTGGGGGGEPQVALAPAAPVVVPGLARDVVKRAKKAGKAIGVKEKIFTKVLEPERVEVSLPTVPELPEELLVGVGPEWDEGAVSGPRVLPSEEIEWGVTELDKEDTRLVLSTYNFLSGAAQRHTFKLPRDDSDFTVRAGSVPAHVRIDRDFDFLRLGVRLTAFGGVNQATGAPSGLAIIEGPISIGTGRLRVSPSAVVGTDSGARIGGTLTFQIGKL